MADPQLGDVVTDPALLQQLERQAASSPSQLGSVVDPTTAAFLNQTWPNYSQAQVKEGMPSLAPNFFSGMAQPWISAWSLLSKGLGNTGLDSSLRPRVPSYDMSKTLPSAADAYAANEAYRKTGMEGPAGTAAELAGNIVGSAPIASAIGPEALGTGLAARTATGIFTGGVSGALQPVNPNAPDYWKQVGHNAELGGVTGGAVPAILSGLSRMLYPNAVSRAAPLLEKGVYPTPGQLLGGSPQATEEMIGSIPFIKDIIRSGQSRAATQFNRGAINDVLAPIGETLESGEIGRPALVEMSDKVSKAFRDAVPRAGGVLDQQALNEINNLYRMSKLTPRAQQFEDLLKSEVLNHVSPNGSITGEAFNNMDSTLGRIVRDNVYGHGVPWQDRQFGQAAQELQSTIRDWMGRVNPQATQDLANAKAAFARQLRVEKAANMAGTGEEPGKFSAAQLLSGVQKYAASPTQLMRGEALMQPYAEAGKQVLGQKVPDSGTASRGIMALLASAAGAGFAGHALAPEATGLVAAGAVGLPVAAGMYSPWGQRLAATLFARRPDLLQPVSQAFRGASQPGAAAAPWVWGALSPTSPTP